MFTCLLLIEKNTSFLFLSFYSLKSSSKKKKKKKKSWRITAAISIFYFVFVKNFVHAWFDLLWKQEQKQKHISTVIYKCSCITLLIHKRCWKLSIFFEANIILSIASFLKPTLFYWLLQNYPVYAVRVTTALST